MKKKKHLSERLPASQFVLLFTVLHSLIVGLGFGLLPLIPNIEALFPFWGVFSIVLAIIPTLLTYLVQSLLFKLQFNWSASRWFQASFVGVMGFFVWTLLASYVPDSTSTGMFNSALRGLAILPIAFAQYLVLRHYVRRAYLWIFVFLLNAMMLVPLYSLMNGFSAFIDSSLLYNILSISFVSSIQGFVLSVMMTLIVRLSMADQQQFSETAQATEEEIQRLEDSPKPDDQLNYEEEAKFQQSRSS